MKFKLVDCKVTGSIKNASKVDLDITGFIESVDDPEPIPPPTDWPNEPEGMNLLTDYAFTDTPPVDGDLPMGNSGWKINYNHPPGYIYPPNDPIGPPWAGHPAGYVELISDNGAPKSPPSVYRYTYPVGMQMGIGCGTVYHPVPRARECYFAFYWKCSDPFYYSTNGTKITFIFNGGGGSGGQMFLIMGADEHLYVFPEYNPEIEPHGVRGKNAVKRGEWHLVEWYVNNQTGEMKVWMDNSLELQADYFTNPTPIDEIQFACVYGGAGGPPIQSENHYYFDHVKICIR